jgi:hypothetical protein
MFNIIDETKTVVIEAIESINVAKNNFKNVIQSEIKEYLIIFNRFVKKIIITSVLEKIKLSSLIIQ